MGTKILSVPITLFFATLDIYMYYVYKIHLINEKSIQNK